MRHPKIIISGIALAAVAAVGGVTAASAGGSLDRPAVGTAAAATVRAERATVGGKSETILVNSGGLPLYFYRPDTAAKSFVTGGLARLWPPLTSAAPVAAGVNGKVAVVTDGHGHQVAYNGHLLYTFTSDHAGQVTGQGLQNFFVAAPGLAPVRASSARGGSVPTAPSNGYGH